MSRRRPKGEGSIIPRTDMKGAYRIRLTVHDPVTGLPRKVSKTVRGSLSQVQKTMRQMQGDIDRGIAVTSSRTMTGEYLERWLRDYAATNVRPSTLERYTGIVRNHFLPTLGKIPLTQLQPGHIQACHAKAMSGRLDGKPGTLSAKSVMQHHRVLSEALDHAVKWGELGRNPAKAVSPPKPEYREMRAMNPEELRRFLETARGTRYYEVFYVLGYTGMRRGEALALKWADVELGARPFIAINRTLRQTKGGKVVFAEPKTAKGRRKVQIDPTTALVLRAFREKQEALYATIGSQLLTTDLMFTQKGGEPLKPDTLTKMASKIAQQAGLGRLRLHDLRHTHASILLQAFDVHPKVVQERLGHSTITTTFDQYSHVVPGLQEAAASRFGEIMSKVEDNGTGTG